MMPGEDVLAADNKPSCPSNIEECIKELKETLPSADLHRFEFEPELVTDEYHLTLGLWIRNNWIRAEGGGRLFEFFHDMGINNPDDMSGIILTSLWRDLHSQPLRVEDQVREYKISYFYNAAQVTEKRSMPEDIWNQKLMTYTKQPIKLADYKGRPIVLVLFANDAESPAAISSLNSMRQSFKKTDLQILGLLPSVFSMSSKEKGVFMDKNHPLFPLIFEDPAGFSRQLRTALLSPGDLRLPETILIGDDGRMITRFNGWDPETTPKLLLDSIHAALGGCEPRSSQFYPHASSAAK
jgi:peroxiredoxin